MTEAIDFEDRFHYPALAHIPETCMTIAFIFLALTIIDNAFIRISLIFFGLYFLLMGLYVQFNTSLVTFKSARNRKSIVHLRDAHTITWGAILMIVGVIILVISSLV